MKVLILGGAGQIAKMATKRFLEQSDEELILYGRNISSRITGLPKDRVTLVDGDFTELDKIETALKGVDTVFLAFVSQNDFVDKLVPILEKNSVKRFIAASIPDIYQEMAGPFTDWYRKTTGIMWDSPYRKAADTIEASSLDYIILRITWLYDDENNTSLDITEKGQEFRSAQVTRQAVAQFVVDVTTGKKEYHRASLGMGEPNTEWEKPSFM